MRLFLSLRLPPDVRAHLAAAVTGLRSTDVAQWHVTLAFLGEQPSEAGLLPGAREVAARTAPLTLRLEGGGVFRGPGVLWAGVAGDVGGLRRLAADLTLACRAAGVGTQERPYRPHVTVARWVHDAGRLAGYAGPTWTATELEVVRSHLGERARHEVLHRLPLGG